MLWVYSSNENEWYLIRREDTYLYTGSSFKFTIPSEEFLRARYEKNKEEIERLETEQEALEKYLQTF